MAFLQWIAFKVKLKYHGLGAKRREQGRKDSMELETVDRQLTTGD